MRIVKAGTRDIETVVHITQFTIDEIYPHYYPRGAVEFFKVHHSDSHIMEDIGNGRVFLLYEDGCAAGTVTVKDNEICRLFVLPAYQHKGFGRALMDFAEGEIIKHRDEIELDASLPAKRIYLQRGYTEISTHRIPMDHGDYLCYDRMRKVR